MFAQVRGKDHEQSAFALGPALGQEQASLDRLSEAHFVRENCTPRERVAKGEERRLDLVGIEVDLGVRKHGRELLDAVGTGSAGERVSEILRVIAGDLQSVLPWHPCGHGRSTVTEQGL